MDRTALLAALAAHQPFDEHEAGMTRRLAAFVEAYEDCFERSLQVGHLTGSAWILDGSRQFVLLVHHAKLDRWLQPGGHSDGDRSLLATARREAVEETGVDVTPLSESIFDIDIHEIPARRHEPAHYHYDVRHVFTATRMDAPLVSPESRDVRWVALDEVTRLNPEPSLARMVAKTRLLQARIVVGCTG
ncbi:MAG: NUDIX hydrolase [Bryobacterales bacterium]|nr:NUDIX hydrolase [Bryobacterales bacterium]